MGTRRGRSLPAGSAVNENPANASLTWGTARRVVAIIAIVSLLFIPVTCASAAGPHSLYVQAPDPMPAMAHTMPGHHAMAMEHQRMNVTAIPRSCAPGSAEAGRLDLPATASELLVTADAAPVVLPVPGSAVRFVQLAGSPVSELVGRTDAPVLPPPR